VIAATAAAPVAAASTAPRVTAWIETNCAAANRVVIYIRNETAEPVQTFVDIDLNGDGVPDAGDGPIVAPGTTLPLNYGLVPNGTREYTVRTAAAVLLKRKVVTDCAPIGLTASVTYEDLETYPVIVVGIRNDTQSSMRVFVDIDRNGDHVPDAGDAPTLASGESQSLRYRVGYGSFFIWVHADAGYVLAQGVGFGAPQQP
jgi:hypothetical protein